MSLANFPFTCGLKRSCGNLCDVGCDKYSTNLVRSNDGRDVTYQTLNLVRIDTSVSIAKL